MTQTTNGATEEYLRIPPAEVLGDSGDPEALPIQTETNWHNPMDYDIVLSLNVGHPPGGGPPFGRPPRTEEERTGKRRVRFPKGKTVALDKLFDTAVQDVRDGQIVGGLAPQLIRMGTQERPKLSPWLDQAKAAEHDAIVAREVALRKAAEAEIELKSSKEQIAALKAQNDTMKAREDALKVREAQLAANEARLSAPPKGR